MRLRGSMDTESVHSDRKILSPPVYHMILIDPRQVLIDCEVEYSLSL